MDKKYYYLLLVLSVIYLGISLLTPVDSASLVKYNVSEFSLRLIGFTVYIPLILIWVAAFYGFVVFKHYSEIIKTSSDGKALSTVSKGLMVMSIGLPVSSVISSALTYGVRLSFLEQNTATIITNYFSLSLALLGYFFVMKGSRMLIAKVQKNKSGLNYLLWGVFAIVAILYIYLTFQNPNRSVSTISGGRATYALPDILILLTIVLPYVVAWFMGILAAFNILHYQQVAQGTIYRQALKYLSTGILFIVISSVFVQFLGVVGNSLQNLSLTSLLVVVYILLGIIALGYILIAFGAKKLTKIEEVV